MNADNSQATASVRRTTLIGAIAILLWSLLALFTTGAKGLQPFQLMAMTFAVAFVASALNLTL